MRALTLVFVLVCVGIVGCSPQPADAQRGTSSESDRILRQAFEQQSSNLQVEGQGTVKRILPDDNDGSKHQRFILELDSGQTLLIAHNVDVAPRIPRLLEGDIVSFKGEFEWNPKGGVIHWTHHDPAGRHPGGWLKHKEKTYE